MTDWAETRLQLAQGQLHGVSDPDLVAAASAVVRSEGPTALVSGGLRTLLGRLAPSDLRTLLAGLLRRASHLLRVRTAALEEVLRPSNDAIGCWLADQTPGVDFEELADSLEDFEDLFPEATLEWHLLTVISEAHSLFAPEPDVFHGTLRALWAYMVGGDPLSDLFVVPLVGLASGFDEARADLQELARLPA